MPAAGLQSPIFVAKYDDAFDFHRKLESAPVIIKPPLPADFCSEAHFALGMRNTAESALRREIRSGIVSRRLFDLINQAFALARDFFFAGVEFANAAA